MMRRTVILSIFISIFIALIATDSWAFCFEEAGAMYGVSPMLLYAIAKTESNFNPKAINKNLNGSYDYGVMQINSVHYKTLGRDLWLSLSDPCTNVKVGAWILAQCIKRYGQTWEAVGCYNAVSSEKRRKYAWRVYKNLLYAKKVQANNSIK